MKSPIGSVPSETRPPAGVYASLLRRIEEYEALDRVVAVVEPRARLLVAVPALKRFFHGDATGIPVHVILTDLPLGAWFMAMYLDLFRDEGTRRAANRLIALGIASAAPTAWSGWAEWALADRATRRVGIVHAGLNGTGVLIFAASLAARRAGRHGLGVGLARLGGAVLVAGGFLGGHMGSGRRATFGG